MGWEADGDLLLRPALGEEAHHELREQRKSSKLVTLQGPMGRLNGIAGIDSRASVLREFLEE